ncbi:hypothetical protein GQ53DRAFT_741900 [Thozetella sp. PMI_491]|nr:hypothetical protein GQ53DRAFT_741900 [Thozetella sp. PMI_491]
MAPATVRRAPYKDFLQPALHRRFSTTASILLAIAYLQALWLANWNSFLWSWFPVGPAGIRTLFLAICGLSIIILRIAQYHVGIRTSTSAFQTFTKNALKLQTVEAVVTYVFSAYIFSQVYLWSLPTDAGLGWITYFSGDRARLNEKPIFLTTHLVFLGLEQALFHLFKDNDRLALGVARPAPGNGKPNGDGANQIKMFRNKLPEIVQHSIFHSVIGLALSLVIYPMFLRQPAWRISLLFFRPFYSLPETNMTPMSYPFTLWVFMRCILSGSLVISLWAAGNAAFSIFLVKEPLKNRRPLTSESKDPNGSLLNGLKSKKLSIQCFAVWELAFIGRDYEERRKMIYEDIGRKDGPMWSQVYQICLEIVKSIEGRIDESTKKPDAEAEKAKAKELEEKEREKEEEERRRKRSKPPKDDPIFQSTPQKKDFLSQVEREAKKAMSSPGQTSPIRPIAEKAFAVAKDTIVSSLGANGDDPNNVVKEAALKLLNCQAGWLFHKEYNRYIETVVLGTPYGEPSLYINAAYALSQFSLHSLREDKYGNVQRDIASIIRTFTSVTRKLEAFKKSTPNHWTDVTKSRETPVVDEIITALKEGLGQLVESFEPYARDLRLSLTDIRLAKEAAALPEPQEVLVGRQPEMRQL